MHRAVIGGRPAARRARVRVAKPGVSSEIFQALLLVPP